MKHKQQIQQFEIMKYQQYAKQYANEILRNQLSVVLLILGDKFGFGKKRLTDFLDHLANYTLSYKNDARYGIQTKSEDVEQILKDEYKLDMDEVIDNICEKNKDFIK